MNYQKTQLCFWCNEVSELTITECFKNRAAQDDFINNNVKYFVFYTSGKLTTDHISRFITPYYFSCFKKGNEMHQHGANDILIFSDGATSNAKGLLNHFLKVWTNAKITFVPIR